MERRADTCGDVRVRRGRLANERIAGSDKPRTRSRRRCAYTQLGTPVSAPIWLGKVRGGLFPCINGAASYGGIFHRSALRDGAKLNTRTSGRRHLTFLVESEQAVSLGRTVMGRRAGTLDDVRVRRRWLVNERVTSSDKPRIRRQRWCAQAHLGIHVSAPIRLGKVRGRLFPCTHGAASYGGIFHRLALCDGAKLNTRAPGRRQLTFLIESKQVVSLCGRRDVPGKREK